MQVLFLVLNDLSYLDKVLEKFVELKLRGATILDSEGMAQAIMKNEGLFGALLGGPFAKSSVTQGSSKTIFTVIPEEEKVKVVVEEIRNLIGEAHKNGAGFMFTLPVSGIFPIKHKE